MSEVELNLLILIFITLQVSWSHWEKRFYSNCLVENNVTELEKIFINECRPTCKIILEISHFVL